MDLHGWDCIADGLAFCPYQLLRQMAVRLKVLLNLIYGIYEIKQNPLGIYRQTIFSDRNEWTTKLLNIVASLAIPL